MGDRLTSDVMQAFEADSPTLGLGTADRKRLEKILKDGWRFTPATMAHKITGGRWIPARHLLYISEIVAAEIAKGGARLIVTMPFRHGKSEFLSIHTPIWFLEHWPHKYVMNLTYGVDLATDFSSRVRDTFLDEDLHHLLRTRLNKRKLKVDRFLTRAGGGLTAAGMKGPITGRGADLMCIDDYVKGDEEAMSASAHKKTYEWFRGTAYPRLEPGASIIVLATRWAQTDLIGRLLTEMPHENWKLISLPFLAMANDPLGREPGEALWPERYDAEAALRIKKTLGSFWFNAQCQQDPPASMTGQDLGQMIKRIPANEMPSRNSIKCIRAWDLAASAGSGDWTAGALVGRDADSGRIYLYDMQRFQKNPGGNKVHIHEKAVADGHGVKIWMEQEPGSAGKTVAEDYDKLLSAFSFQAERATGPIEFRAGPLIASIEAGDVFMMHDGIDYDDMSATSWNRDVRDEFNGFPEPDHDDQIVAFALAYNKLTLGIRGGLTWGRQAFENVHDIRDARRLKQQQELNKQQLGSRRRIVW